jgi:anti-sigma factor RsiW
MNRCDDLQGLLARLADGAAAELDAGARARVEAHLADCASCRMALADQRQVAGVLRSRPAVRPTASFAASLSARLDDASGWLGMLDWRAWTFRLAPVAMALGVIAFATGASTVSSSGETVSTPATIDSWTRGVSESSPAASAVWQDVASSDALLERMLTGGSTGQQERSDAR